MNKSEEGVGAPDNISRTTSIGFDCNKSLGENPSEYFEGERFVPKWLADRIMMTYAFKTMRDTDEIFVYIEGVYLNNGKSIIESVAQARLGSKSNNHRVSEVVGHITRATRCDRDEFDNDPDIINLDNGLFHVDTMELSPHTSKYLSFEKSMVVYDQDASCPRINEFIRDVVSSEHVETIYEICGYAMSSRKNLKRAFIFEGEKNTGKSKTTELIEAMVGNRATTHVSPLEVSRTIYASAEYYGKKLNVVDDLGNTPIENTGILKSIIGGGRINAQFKYAQPFDYTPNVVCIFATNEVPTTGTFDEAFASRFSIIKFDNVFEGTEADVNLMDKLTSSNELSGMFNECMHKLTTLIDSGAFTGDGTLATRINEYRYSSNPMRRFVDTRCIISDPDDYILKDDLYHAYILWARDNKSKVVEMKVMTITLKSLGCTICQVTTDDNERKRAYTGIRLKGNIADY